MAEINELLGTTLWKIHCDCDELVFTSVLGRKWKMHHHQDCCEEVSIEDIIGDLQDLIGAPILMAEAVTQESDKDESGTWTFYKLATANGYVTIRWYGSSNGYYSEEVSFDEITEDDALKRLIDAGVPIDDVYAADEVLTSTQIIKRRL